MSTSSSKSDEMHPGEKRKRQESKIDAQDSENEDHPEASVHSLQQSTTPTQSTFPSLTPLLSRIGLQEYESKLKENGYDTVEKLRAVANNFRASASLMIDIGMTPAEFETLLSSAAPSCDEVIQGIVTDYDKPNLWVRPTPRPKSIHRSVPLYWPSSTTTCDKDVLPTSNQLSTTGRNTALGIGNAFGTGKTELALLGAENTVKQEKGVEVAYCSFSNGYADDEIAKTLVDNSVYNATNKKSRSKYAGLWLFAAKKATRVVNGEVQGNQEMFKQICCTFLKHPEWSLPDYRVEAHANLIVIIDEVQQFNYDALDGFVTNVVVPAKTRSTILVGAYSPSFSFGSGNRLYDCEFKPLSEKDMESIFKDTFPKTLMKFNGVSLPSLFGSCLRPLIEFKKGAVLSTDDPVQDCCNQFDRVYRQRHKTTPGTLFRAAIADVPCGREVLEDQFKENNTSLGSSIMTRTSSGHYSITQPPLLIHGGNFELKDVDNTATDKEKTETCVRDVLKGFVMTNWSKFEDLTGIAAALRIASLSHQKEMEFQLGGKEILELVFGGGICNASASLLLKKPICGGLKVKKIHGGNSVELLDIEAMIKEASPDCLLDIMMNHDHDCEFDHILLVPLVTVSGTQQYLMIYLDSKYTEDVVKVVDGKKEKKTTLDFNRDIKPKLDNYQKLMKMESFFPAKYVQTNDIFVAVVTNRYFPSSGTVFHNGVKGAAEPLVLCGKDQLPDVMSNTLVPPKFRGKSEKR